MIVNDPRVQEQISELCGLLAETKDKELLKSFLYCLLTPAEAADIAGRWALVKALYNGKTQREIAKDLGVSLCKITRGSRELKKTGSAFRQFLKMLDNLNLERRTKDCPSGTLNPNNNNCQD